MNKLFKACKQSERHMKDRHTIKESRTTDSVDSCFLKVSLKDKIVFLIYSAIDLVLYSFMAAPPKLVEF